ncbi:MAG: cobyrinate a,c-diamide synthase [Desulfohalobiaceae bacterium]|nr:cobyrinate a,c-diamide synthase [Desulfohalobiaceae bacterium]
MSMGLVIGGANSGCGKTSIALALMAWFGRQGKRVVPFKVGPDFIDPGHHARITGRRSTNLDGWMLSREMNEQLFARHAAQGNIALVEGVMGLFDGFDGKSESGSTAQMAKWLNLPVILVVNAQSMARSAAALVQGFENFDPELQFAGVIFNKLGSPGHLDYLREALEETVRMSCLGGILRDEDLKIPERHLGLYTAEDWVFDQNMNDALVEVVEQGLNTAQLFDLLPEQPVEASPPSSGSTALEAPSLDTAEQTVVDSGLSIQMQRSQTRSTVRLAVARDKAFCFYYQENLDLLEQAGAEIVLFSPLADSCLPQDIQGIYLGGGYPELHAETLAANTGLLGEINAESRQGMPIYAECGGFMYLCRELQTLEGETYGLCNCFPFSCSMLPRLKTLGYREVHLESEALLGPAGTTLRGHEFHYSELAPASDPVPRVYRKHSRKGREQEMEGYLVAKTLGSYIHVHFGSNPRAAGSFVQSCREFAGGVQNDG